MNEMENMPQEELEVETAPAEETAEPAAEPKKKQKTLTLAKFRR